MRTTERKTAPEDSPRVPSKKQQTPRRSEGAFTRMKHAALHARSVDECQEWFDEMDDDIR